MTSVSWLRRLAINVAAASALTVVALSASPASAQYQYITVNGVQLTPDEIVYVQNGLGFMLPSGHYWYDDYTGYWGLVGGPALGQVGGTYQQNGGTGQNYSNGSSAYSSDNGVGVLIDPGGAEVFWD